MELVKHGAPSTKRQQREDDEEERPNKKTASFSLDLIAIDESTLPEKIYKFKVLLPNGSSVEVRIKDPEFMIMPTIEFKEYVKHAYRNMVQNRNIKQNKRGINWDNSKLCFRDLNNNEYDNISFTRFGSDRNHTLILQDGSKEAVTYEIMWDLTPDTELLRELPAEYTFETALADLIDNSLQAVWSNHRNYRRLISVELTQEKISIFDTGPGMDGSDENSIVKWGKMGASLNRSSRGNAIGGKPPYLKPFFGMFGYGGSIASIHLGRHALVSSKTKDSKMVWTLQLDREALLGSKEWRIDGGIRNPTDDEMEESPHGSFTKVEIFEPRMNDLDAVQLMNRLKDIYFPYIQCDELSKGKTSTSVEFQVNETDLTEIIGGEVAITNMFSCNGPNLEFQLRFTQDVPATNGKGTRASQEANARLKFVYFPMTEGTESIEKILAKLKEERFGITETFESFNRVSIRRLGRLLPDARWNFLPFMKYKQQRGEKGQILKRCCSRVKCFIDTDAGFNPTPSKTDLAHHHLYTTVLKNFGDKPLEKGKGVNVDISIEKKPVTLSQLEKQYQEWIFQMHDMYDKEVECGEDQPILVLVLSKSEKKKLCISADVLRVHKVIPRKGFSWKSGQKIKLIKGAGPGVYTNNVYASLEYILLEGLQGDAGGEARLICRPLAVPEKKGCNITWTDDKNALIDIGDSLSLPVSIIDRDQCVPVDDADWEKQVERQSQKQPSAVDILSEMDCLELEIDGALPSHSTVNAGHISLENIVAVVRPASFTSASGPKSLDQKYIVKDNLEIFLQIQYNDKDHIYSGTMGPSSRKSLHGLYIFPMGGKCANIFKKAGVYTFKLSLGRSNIRSAERKIEVKALSEVSSWELLCDRKSPPFMARVGSCFPPISIACYDTYKNQIPFPSVPQITIEVRSGEMLVAVIDKHILEMSSDKLCLTIEDTLVETKVLDCIRPTYKCTLYVSSKDGDFSILIPCQVHPGDFQDLKFQPKDLKKKVVPGHTIDELILEMFDRYGNHVSEGLEVTFSVKGFDFVDHLGLTRKVDERGIINLSGLLKVTDGYGKKVSISAFFDEKLIFKRNFETGERELRVASEVQEFCMAGSLLEHIVFVIVNSEGDVDKTFSDDEKCGVYHALVIKSDSFDTEDTIRYSFRNGYCTVRAINVPQNEGMACYVAAHSRYPELNVTFKVNVLQAPNSEPAFNASQHSHNRNIVLQNSLSCYTPKIEKENNYSQISSEGLLVLQDSPVLRSVQDLVISNFNSSVKELEDDCLKWGENVGLQEKTLTALDSQRVALNEEICMLEDSLGPISIEYSGFAHGKEKVLELIEEKKESAASIICKTLRGDISEREQMFINSHILGVVALMGRVQTYDLSRILAEYLGEDHMLAVVCSSYSAVENLEFYDNNGNVDYSTALHDIAAKLGVSISGRYPVICLEDTSPFVGDLCNYPERKLKIPDPFLPNGITPPGFLGFAVNMIDLDEHSSLIKTGSGHGLRETLFYRLFGELQVYETRKYMNKARACIKYGAVSLDGGIMRSGILYLGSWQSKICFPVTSVGYETNLSQDTIKIKKQIDEKKSELRQNQVETKKNERLLEKVKKKFEKKRKSFERSLKKSEEVLNNFKPLNSVIKNL